MKRYESKPFSSLSEARAKLSSIRAKYRVQPSHALWVEYWVLKGALPELKPLFHRQRLIGKGAPDAGIGGKPGTLYRDLLSGEIYRKDHAGWRLVPKFGTKDQPEAETVPDRDVQGGPGAPSQGAGGGE